MEDTNLLMAFLTTKTLSIPVGQIILFTVVISICMLMDKLKLGLISTYAFVFYWGFVFNREFFIDAAGNTSWGLFAYAFFGLSLAVMALVAFFSHPHN